MRFIYIYAFLLFIQTGIAQEKSLAVSVFQDAIESYDNSVGLPTSSFYSIKILEYTHEKGLLKITIMSSHPEYYWGRKITTLYQINLPPTVLTSLEVNNFSFEQIFNAKVEDLFQIKEFNYLRDWDPSPFTYDGPSSLIYKLTIVYKIKRRSIKRVSCKKEVGSWRY